MEYKPYTNLPFEIYGPSYKESTFKDAFKELGAFCLVGAILLAGVVGTVGVCYASALYYFHGLRLI